MADKRTNSIHVRICDTADAALELMSQMQGRDKSAVAAELLEDALLGRAHAPKVAARRFVRLEMSESERE